MGHTDTLTISDCGLPMPSGVKRIDLAIKPGLPSFIEVLENVRGEMVVEKITIAEEMIINNEEIYEEIKKMFEDVEIEFVSHEEFKKETEKSKAIIRTGECTPYANVMLSSGVIF